MKKLLHVPEGETGVFIAGGWHNAVKHPVHGMVLELPAEGDYTALQRIGYAEVQVGVPQPDATNVTSDRPAPLPTPLQPRTKSA